MSLPGQGNDYRDFLLGPMATRVPQIAWEPAVDLYRCEQGWLVKFDLAGIHQEDIELSLQGSTLVVRGRRRDLHVEPRGEAYRLEIAYSHFARLVELPESVQPAELLTDYRDGMLFVRIIKRQANSTKNSSSALRST